MLNRPEAQEHKITTTCEVDADTRESLLKHLDEHGAVSLLTSARFGQYAGCFLEEVERSTVAESVVIASAADDSTGNQSAPPPPADAAIASLATMLVRVQTGCRIVSDKQGRS